MKLVRLPATEFDSELPGKYRKRGVKHVYQVQGNWETEQAALHLVDEILFSLISFDDEQDWYRYSCTCPDYAEGYGSRFMMDIDYSNDFKELWKLIKAEIKQLKTIPTGEGELLLLGYEIAKKLAAAHKHLEVSDRHFNFYKRYYPELEQAQEPEQDVQPESTNVPAEPIEYTAPVQKTEGGKKIHITPDTPSDEIESYRLVSPCKDCPFRSDLPAHLKGWLGRERATQIARSLFTLGQTFQCHKTTEHNEDDEDGYKLKGCEFQCAGASIMQIKLDCQSQWMQVAQRMGYKKETEAIKRLDLDAPVFDSPEAFIEFHSR